MKDPLEDEDQGDVKANPIFGDPVNSYLSSFLIASIMFVFSISEIMDFSLALALFGWFLGGFLAAQILMPIPWTLAVYRYQHTTLAGWIYFPLVGAALTLTLGCTAACFMPTLLNVEDHTFLEAFSIALERQGPSFALSGLTFGLTFWLLYVRFPNLL